MNSAPRRPQVFPASAPSLIETIRIDVGGTVPLLDGHLARLQRSATILGYPWPGEAPVRAEIARAASELDTQRCWRLRVLLGPEGELTLEHSALEAPAAVYKVVLNGPRPRADEDWLLHKSTHRPWYAAATQWLAAHPEIFDVLYWNEDEDMCEGSRTNLYMQSREGQWLTPRLSAGVLPGVQRQALVDAGQVHEAHITRADFVNAKAIRISNALRGWRNAVVVDQEDDAG